MRFMNATCKDIISSVEVEGGPVGFELKNRLLVLKGVISACEIGKEWKQNLQMVSTLVTETMKKVQNKMD